MYSYKARFCLPLWVVNYWLILLFLLLSFKFASICYNFALQCVITSDGRSIGSLLIVATWNQYAIVTVAHFRNWLPKKWTNTFLHSIAEYIAHTHISLIIAQGNQVFRSSPQEQTTSRRLSVDFFSRICTLAPLRAMVESGYRASMSDGDIVYAVFTYFALVCM